MNEPDKNLPIIAKNHALTEHESSARQSQSQQGQAQYNPAQQEYASHEEAYDRGYQEGLNRARQEQSRQSQAQQEYSRQGQSSYQRSAQGQSYQDNSQAYSQAQSQAQKSSSEGQFMSDKNFTYLLYGLSIGGYFTGGLTNLAALILAYVKRGDVTHTIFYSHMENIIHTTWIAFWVGLFGAFLMFTVIFAIIGWPLLAILFIWTGYRFLKGFLRLSDNRAYD